MKTFHPIRSRDRYKNWHPANEAANLIVHISHTWEDLNCLKRILKERDNTYEKKLLFRYCLIEIKSLLDLFDKLQPIVMKRPVYSKTEEIEWRGLLVEEKKKVKRLFKIYHEARDKIYSDLRDMRNKISAHRDVDSWDDIIALWDKLDYSNVNPLLKTIPPLFNYVKDLDIYEWSAELEEGIFTAIGPKINPQDWAS